MAKPETYSTLSLMYLKSRLRYHLSYELCMNAPNVCFMYVEWLPVLGITVPLSQ